MEISIYEKCISDVAAPWSLTSDVSVCNFNCHVSGLYYTKERANEDEKKAQKRLTWPLLLPLRVLYKFNYDRCVAQTSYYITIIERKLNVDT